MLSTGIVNSCQAAAGRTMLVALAPVVTGLRNHELSINLDFGCSPGHTAFSGGQAVGFPPRNGVRTALRSRRLYRRLAVAPEMVLDGGVQPSRSEVVAQKPQADASDVHHWQS